MDGHNDTMSRHASPASTYPLPPQRLIFLLLSLPVNKNKGEAMYYFYPGNCPVLLLEKLLRKEGKSINPGRWWCRQKGWQGESAKGKNAKDGET